MKDKNNKEKLTFDFSKSLKKQISSVECPVVRIDQDIPQSIQISLFLRIDSFIFFYSKFSF